MIGKLIQTFKVNKFIRRVNNKLKVHPTILKFKVGNITNIRFRCSVPSVELNSSNENDLYQYKDSDILDYGMNCVLIEKKNDHKWVVKLKEDGLISTHIGPIYHNHIKEAGFGGSIILPNGKRIEIRRLTFEEYVVSLKRNVTPIYPKDLGRIVSLLDIQPGNKILEAGTGSGSMTLYLARAVGVEGEVWSYEIREEFHNIAKKLINQWPLESKSIKLFSGSVDTCDAEERYFDGIFLDLLNPELVLGNIQHLIKEGKPVVLLLLHITQVCDLIEYINTNNLNFQVEKTIEVSERSWFIDLPKCRPQSYGSSKHTGFLVQLIKTNKTVQLN